MTTFNPDYFKVAGGTTHGGSFGPGLGDSAQRFASMKALLKNSRPHRSVPPAGPPKRRRQKEAKAKARTNAPKNAEPALHIEPIHQAHPQHGKKRRSARKRHELEMRPIHAREMGAHAPHIEAPEASVTRLRDRRRPPESGAPSTLPPSLQALLRNSADLARETARVAVGLVTLPFNVARVLIRLRNTGVPD